MKGNINTKKMIGRDLRWKDDTAYGFLCTLPKTDFPELKFEESPKQIELNIL